MDKILVALNIAEESDELLRSATKMAKAFSSTVYLVCVEIAVKGVSGLEARDAYDEIVIDHKDDVEKINFYANKLRQQDIETHAIVITGVMSSSIIDEAKKIGADLIVMGSHGHSALESFFSGGVGKAVVKASPCPVLLVPTHA